MKTSKLEKFLINRGLLEKFKLNLKNHGMYFTRLDYLLKNVDSKNLIFNAFTWFNTDDGLNYWENVHREWIKSIKKNTL